MNEDLEDGAGAAGGEGLDENGDPGQLDDEFSEEENYELNEEEDEITFADGS